MGKASSSKKVARAAKAGGSLRERPKLGYPLGLFVIVLLGVGLVGYARADRLSVVSSGEPPSASKQDHWHSAYGVYVCDHFLPADPDLGKDPDGIHTHGDGVMHVHPFGTKASGVNAKLKIFANTVDWTLGTDSITIGGVTYGNGYDCGGKPAKVLVYRWSDAFDQEVYAEVFDKDFGEIRFRTDRSAFTIAVVPEGTPVPRPDSVNTLNSLSDVAGANTSSSLPQGLDPSALDPSSLDPTAIDPSLSIPTDSLSTESIPTDSVVPADGVTPSTPVADAVTPSTPAVDPAAPSTPPPTP